MYTPKAEAGKRPVLRIVPKEPRPWRVAWKEAEARKAAAKAT
jgi:hypothetical protein